MNGQYTRRRTVSSKESELSDRRKEGKKERKKLGDTMLERRLGAGAREKKAQHGRGLKRVGWSLGPDSEPSATDPSK